MISLKEILNKIEDDKNIDLLSVDDWKWPFYEYLIDMKFERHDDYHMKLESPSISVSQNKNHQFIIEEPKGKKNTFEKFDDVIAYFDAYKQDYFQNG